MDEKDRDEREAAGEREDKVYNRREAIKRIGILGLGVVFGSRPKQADAQARPATCYRNNCYNRYASTNQYSPGPPYRVYNSLNTYSSICYYSCS